MSLQAMDREELLEMSMVEIAFEIMKESKQPFDYYELAKQVAAMKEMSQQELDERIANLYTDMNIDGRFHSLGDNRWGLKSWYPLEQAEEEITTPVKPRKKAKAKADLDDIDTLDDDFEDFEDEYEDLEDELDEIADADDSDVDVDEFDDTDEIDDIDSDDDSDDDDSDLDDEDDLR
ncbi:DNA-directed RNA polymerase subunit delta [Halalkalibacter krulwichiae]|nr:DNA-directed RNA polymerase subunit delta [Halalkalibacter krulwichiae]